MGRFVDGLTSWEERQQQTKVEHLREPSSLEKILECRVMGQWLQVVKEVPEQGERRAQVAEPCLGGRVTGSASSSESNREGL